MQPQILLVEDCPKEPARIVGWLAEALHPVGTTTDEEKGLAKLRANRPTVLLLASPLHGFDAQEFLRHASSDLGGYDPAVIPLERAEHSPPDRCPWPKLEVISRSRSRRVR